MTSLKAKFYDLTHDTYMRLAENTTFDELFPEKNLIFYSNQDISTLLRSIPNAYQKLRDMGLLQIGNNYHFLLYRLVLQPSDKLRSAIFSILQKPEMKQCIGIQVRTGNLANKKEEVVFLTEFRIKRYIRRINKMYTGNETVYLSSDSDYAIQLVNQQLKNHTVITNSHFPISHSSLSENNQGLERALIDAIVSSHCNPIYITQWSTFGMLIRYLSFSVGVGLLRCSMPKW